MEYPKARKEKIIDDFHGVKIEDPYRWMEGTSDPELMPWIEAQNKLVDEYIDKSDLEKYKKRLSELFNYPRYSVPIVRGDKYFYTKNDGLQPQGILYMKVGINGEPKVVFDPNTLSEDGTVAVMGTFYSHDAKYLAMAISTHGSDWQEIRILDIDKKEFLDETIQNVRNGSGLQWLKDSSGFYYSAFVGKDEGSGGQKLWFHKLHTNQDNDKLVFEHPTDDKLWVFSKISHDEKYIFLIMSKSTMPRNLLYFGKVGDNSFTPIIDELKDLYSVLDVDGSRAIIHTNKDADNGKIVSYNLETGEWNELIPENKWPIESAVLANHHIAVVYNKNASHIFQLYDMNGNKIKDIDLPTFGTIFNPSGKIDKDHLFFIFTSFTYPTMVFNYNFETGELEEFHKPALDLDSSIYEVKQVFYNSKDGTKIPMFILHKKDLKYNGNTQTLLYGYGGFGISLTPMFNQRAFAWMEDGGIYAIANLRGGGEYGEKWHHAGMLEKKQNVFDDFIAAAEYLISNNYTTNKKLAILGGSNGGLLTAACMLQRPDLFGAVITAVGVLDMLRYHLFTIGRFWVPEYGDPNNPEHFKFLIKYSPLHNVKEVEYPPTLIHTADTDDRVDPAHSKKYAATLQEKGKGGPLLLRVVVKAGHGAGKPITKMIEDIAYEFAFLKKALNY